MSATVAERIPQHLIDQAKAANILSLAERRSELRKVAAAEYAGPCPKCGGTDRLHLNDRAGWWFCRQCHPSMGDSIEFVRWLDPGLSFAEAVQRLAGGASIDAPPVLRAPERKPAPQKQTDDWRQNAERLVADAHEQLWSGGAEQAQQYLLGRGLEPATWMAYGLGYRADAPLPGTKGKQRAPAIVLPWRSKSLGVYAIRYRFLTIQKYEDADGTERSEKLVAETGSQFAGRLFGGQVLPGFVSLPLAEDEQPIEGRRWLLIVEGEINAASCWQMAHETALDVLSLGSESAKLTPAAVQFAQRYGRVLVWADKIEVAQGLMAALPGAYGISSPGGKDANDLLRSGHLGGFLALVRANAAQDKSQIEALLWAMWDGANTLNGLDTGSAHACMSLADRLGKQVRLIEPEPGRWITVESFERV